MTLSREEVEQDEFQKSLPASTILFFSGNRVSSSFMQHYVSDYWSYHYCNFSFRLWKLLQATVETAVMSWRKERWRLSSPWLVSLIISTSGLRITWNPRSLKISRPCWRRPRRRLVSSGSVEFRPTGEQSMETGYSGAVTGSSSTLWATGCGSHPHGCIFPSTQSSGQIHSACCEWFLNCARTWSGHVLDSVSQN